jgi:pentafunctional AROM polypeptide
MTIPELIRSQGWDVFRAEELALLNRVMKEKTHGYILACGGGIVESEQARQTLSTYQRDGGTVLLISRDIAKVMDFLNLDKTRPAYTEDMMGRWT